MRHAYLIMAHNEPKILRTLIRLLDYEDIDIYLHIDSKSDISQFGLSDVLCHKSRLFVLTNRIDVRWGGYSQIRCEMLLMETAFKQGWYDYYHIMSGVTLPIKKITDIIRFFEEHQGLIFLGIDTGDIENTIGDRIKYYNLFMDVNKKLVGEQLVNRLNGLSYRIQKLLPINNVSSLPLKIGSQWCSITSECVKKLLNSRKWIEKTFKYGYCVDELYKQTVIWNSPLREKLYSVGNSLEGCLYEIDWNRGSVHSPYTYAQISDVELLLNSNRLFARKFSDKYIEVVDKLIEKVHK